MTEKDISLFYTKKTPSLTKELILYKDVAKDQQVFTIQFSLEEQNEVALLHSHT